MPSPPRVSRSGPLVSRSFVSLRDRGFVENGLKFVYYAAAATARYDSVSHMLPAHVLANECDQYASTPVAGCDAHMGQGATPAVVEQAPAGGRQAQSRAAAGRRAGAGADGSRPLRARRRRALRPSRRGR